MNIADVIGPVDVYSAVVALGIGGATTIITVTALSRTGARKLALDYELSKLKLQNDLALQQQANDISRERELSKIMVEKEIEFKRIDSGMVDVKVAEGRK